MIDGDIGESETGRNDAADTAGARPVIRLRPKVEGRLIRDGIPWVYADNLVLDRRSRAVAPGSIVTLEDAERSPLATGAFNPLSKIAFRLLDPDPEALIDKAWLGARLARALALRERLFDAPYYRLVHAEGDGLPGLVIDRFGDTAVIQPNAAWAEARVGDLAALLGEIAGISTVLKNAGSRVRALEGLDGSSGLLAGSLAGPVPVEMNGATYMADLEGGQKTGLFYDQRPNHAFAARLAGGGRVLDLFTHVGGFALAALAAGAAHAVAVDSSAPALALAEEGAVRSGLADRLEIRRGDCFEVATALAGQGARFDLVVSDPPAFAPAKPALEAGLRAYQRIARLSAGLVAPGGYLVLCSCSHAADLARFRAACLRGIAQAGRSAQILATGGAGPDHPMHPHLAETGYLKALFLRLDG